jgi:hypothetical protein
MSKITHYAWSSALPAIAAALALSSTPLLAQEAQPVTDPPAQPAPDPAPVTDATPVTPEPAAPTAESAPEAMPEAVAPATTTRASSRVAARPVPKTEAATPTRTRAATTQAAPTRTAIEPAAGETRELTQSAPSVGPSAPIDAAPAPAVAAEPARKDGSDVPVIAGGALALLALGGGAFALARRRRDDDEDVWVDDETIESAEPVAREHIPEPAMHEEQPRIVAPAASAFTWGNTQAAEPGRPAGSTANADDDRMPGESWVERAYRGPTANNPSVSLRNRLKRAAFFDKREREVAAGTAAPVDMDAGLPDAMVEDRERELV